MGLGLAGTVLICGLTPYNDYALNNTFLVGNNLPLGVVMLMFLFSVLVNAPLSRWAPRHALSSGEMAVALAMMLVSCALPSTGLMRYFPASLTAPIYYSRENAEFAALLAEMDLPDWLFPSLGETSREQWMNDPVIWGFHRRWTESGPIPYGAWVRPAMTWGVFIFAMYGAILCMVTILRRQWFENERLPFPLAQIQLALVEQPKPGRALNSIFGRRSFWIAFAAVFLLHAYNGLSNYYPRYIARVPVGYSIHEILAEPPWSYLDSKVKDNTIFFAALGVAYFLPGSVSFSLWIFYLLFNVRRMLSGAFTGDEINHGRFNEHFGGLIAYTLMIAWIGRHHWRLVFAQALRGRRPGEPDDPYLPYRLAFWGFVGCAAVMIVWLVLAGCRIDGAILLVLLLLTLMMLITRFIAETGLIHGQLQLSLVKPWNLLGYFGYHPAVPLETYYLGTVLNSVHYDYREVLAVYASHGLKVMDQVQHQEPRRHPGMRLIGLMMLALLVGYVTSLGSMLWTEYTFDATRDAIAKSPINEWGARDNPRIQVIDLTAEYNTGQFYSSHNIPLHIAGGFSFTALLAFLRLRFSWWPLHPLGYVLVLTYPVAHLWFSLMLGWLARTLILRFGGASLYTGAKPFFIGLIVGESMAAGGWLVVGIVLSALGVPYRPVSIMPG